MQLWRCELTKHPRSQHISCNLIGFDNEVLKFSPAALINQIGSNSNSFIHKSSLHFNTKIRAVLYMQGIGNKQIGT